MVKTQSEFFYDMILMSPMDKKIEIQTKTL